MKILLIGVGGAFGAVSRYFVSKYTLALFGSRLPWGTLAVNVLGSFLLGWIFTMSVEKLAVSENMRFLLAVGFLGAFTTFSTFSVESVKLLEDGTYFLFFLNVVFNVVLCIAASVGGIWLGRL